MTSVTATVMYDGVLDVHYGFVDVCVGVEPDGDLVEARRGQQNGLCGAGFAHRLALVTGLHTGEVPLRIEWHPNEPPLVSEWDEVVEVSLDVPSGDGMLTSFEDGADLVFPQTGWHRVRYCGHDMDAGNELDTSDEDEPAPDRYLLQLWPAPPAPDAIVEQTSAIAGYWHSVARGEA